MFTEDHRDVLDIVLALETEEPQGTDSKPARPGR
jgi:hypothetical protein